MFPTEATFSLYKRWIEKGYTIILIPNLETKQKKKNVPTVGESRKDNYFSIKGLLNIRILYFSRMMMKVIEMFIWEAVY